MSVNPQEWFQWYTGRLQDRLRSLVPKGNEAAFNAAFKPDPATQAVLEKGLAYAALTPDQRRAQIAKDEDLRLGVKGQEQSLANTTQRAAADNTLYLNRGNTEVLGDRERLKTTAFVDRNKALTENQIALINATNDGQYKLMNGLTSSVIPQLLQHEKEMDNQNFSQNLPFMLGNLALGAAALFA